MTAPHLWCQILGITPPRLEAAKGHREANTFALLLVALLERQQLMTLAEVAERFEAAGIAPRARALTSLQRCRPARAPVYRDGDRYGLDPYDDLLRLWTSMLDLRTPPPAPAAPAPKPTRRPRGRRRPAHGRRGHRCRRRLPAPEPAHNPRQPVRFADEPGEAPA